MDDVMQVDEDEDEDDASMFQERFDDTHPTIPKCDAFSNGQLNGHHDQVCLEHSFRVVFRHSDWHVR